MTTTANYLSTIMDDGKLAINEALTQGKKLKPYAFIIGDAYNFVPDKTATDPVQGNKVYIGGQSLISAEIKDKETAAFTVTVPENAGPFTVGNILLQLQADDGTIFNAIWYVSKIPYPKTILTSAGSRLVITFVQKIINAEQALAITVVPPAFSSLAGYPTEADLPKPENSLFQQFVVQDPVYTQTPVIGTRRTLDNQYWAMPLSSRLDEPFFGILDGGKAAEGKRPYDKRWFWGGRLGMPPNQLPFNYGGLKLTDNGNIANIGGDPLPAFRGYRDDGDLLSGAFIWGGRLEFPQAWYLSNWGCKLTDTPENTFGGIPLPPVSY